MSSRARLPNVGAGRTTWVVLLRGINVGRAKRVAMADLREAVAACGFTDVTTLLNSGNVVAVSQMAVNAPESAAAVRAALLGRTGVDAAVLVLPADHVRAVAAANPLVDVGTDDSRLMVSLLSEPVEVGGLPVPDMQALGDERIAVTSDAVYQWCPDGVLKSRVPATFWQAIAPATVTARNWRTLTRVLAAVDRAEGG